MRVLESGSHDGVTWLHCRWVTRFVLLDWRSSTQRFHAPRSRRLNASQRRSGDTEGKRSGPSLKACARPVRSMMNSLGTPPEIAEKITLLFGSMVTSKTLIFGSASRCSIPLGKDFIQSVP